MAETGGDGRGHGAREEKKTGDAKERKKQAAGDAERDAQTDGKLQEGGRRPTRTKSAKYRITLKLPN